MGVPILGVVENMSYLEGPLGENFTPFGEGAGKALSEKFGFSFLGKIPIHTEISRCGDLGIALPFAFPNDSVTILFEDIVKKLRSFLYSLEEAEKTCLKQFEYIWEEDASFHKGI